MNHQPEDFRVCTKGVWNTSIPDISFDKNGISNYAFLHERLTKEHPRGTEGQAKWDKLVAQMKERGKGKTYDCIIGVSGGTDSSYLLHIAHEAGIRVLAVNLDNGWSSDISVRNIKKVTGALNIDLETYVIDYEEVKDVLVSYIKAGLPWIDGPTDMAIKAILFGMASREGIKYVLNGADFRSEGKQPMDWTYGDAYQFKKVYQQFGRGKLKTYPRMNGYKQLYYSLFKKIKMNRPLYYLEYNKPSAQKLLEEKYDWEYYGGHHHENIFTKFAIAYWLPKKFNIDKRIITLSAQVMSGDLDRDAALAELAQPPYDPEEMEKDKAYVIKKLGLEEETFSKLFAAKNKYHYDYPSYLPFINRFFKSFSWLTRFILPDKPILVSTLEEKRKHAK